MIDLDELKARAEVGYLPIIKSFEVLTLIAELKQLRECKDEAIEVAKFYAQTRRDTSFEGWEKEWKYIEAKHDYDYEYYPNHDSALEWLEKWAGK